MHSEVYANRRTSAQAETLIPINEAENYLHLLPEHRNEINNQWLSHLCTQRISGNGLRIVTSIYRYTVGFNKIEDDMSGTRLEQISCIRSDHANHTLQLLANDHIILSRKGSYGRILSINFDFASWGKIQDDTDPTTLPKLIGDPRYLLPARYRDKPIDTGNLMSAGLSTDYASSPVTVPQCESQPLPNVPHPPKSAKNTAPPTPQPSQTKKPPIANTPNPSNSQTEKPPLADAPQPPKRAKNTAPPTPPPDSETTAAMAKTVQASTDIMQKLLKKLTQLEQRIDTLQTPQSTAEHSPSPVDYYAAVYSDDQHVQDLIHATTPENQSTQIHFIDAEKHDNSRTIPESETHTTADAAPVAKSETHTTTDAKPIPTSNTHIPASPNASSATFQKPQKESSPDTAHPLKTTTKTTAYSKNFTPVADIATDIVTNIQTQAALHVSNETLLNNLRYPSVLDKNTCQALGGLLLKAKDQAQNILDLLALRLQNTQNPINDIVFYCSSLVHKARSNDLDLDTLKAHRIRQQAAPSAAEQEMQTLQQEYQAANSDYQHFKRIHKAQSRSYQCSVEEYLQKKGLESFWHNIVERLAQVKRAIDQISAQ